MAIPIAENQNMSKLKWIDFIVRAMTARRPSLKATKTITRTPISLPNVCQLLPLIALGVGSYCSLVPSDTAIIITPPKQARIPTISILKNFSLLIIKPSKTVQKA